MHLIFWLETLQFSPKVKREISLNQFKSEQPPPPPPMEVSPNTSTTLENFTFFFTLLSWFFFKAYPSK